MESNKRSLFKTATWYVSHLTVAGTVAFVVTKDIRIAAILASEKFKTRFVQDASRVVSQAKYNKQALESFLEFCALLVVYYFWLCRLV